MEANANITGESAEEIMLNQQEFLLESIRTVPELTERRKLIADEIGNQDLLINQERKTFSVQEDKIKRMELEKGRFLQDKYMLYYRLKAIKSEK